MKAKPWTRSQCCRCGRSYLRLSFLFYQDVLTTRWKKFCLRSTPSLNCWHRWFKVKFKPSMSATAPVILKALPTNSKPPLSSCKVNSWDIQTQHLLTFATCIYLPKGTAKEQGHGRRSYEVFSLNALYQSQEDYWNIMFKSTAFFIFQRRRHTQWGLPKVTRFQPPAATRRPAHCPKKLANLILVLQLDRVVKSICTCQP